MKFYCPKIGVLNILVSNSTNIYFNLAAEEYLYEKCDVLAPVLLLYRNDKAIIFGKH